MTNFSALAASVRRSIFQTIAVFSLVALLFSSTALGVIIYDNGNVGSGANSGSGTAAPAGTQWSEAQNEFGITNAGGMGAANTLAGVSCSVTATLFRCADDFNVPVGQTWTINQVIVFAYQTGFAGTTSPITAATLRIWNGRPNDAGSTIVFGDTTTNRLASSTDSLNWRIFSSTIGVGASPPTVPVTNRRVWQNNITVSPAAVLTAGNYWIDWNTAIGTAAHFAPTTTTVGTRAVPFTNARQFTGAAWVDVTDAGQAPTGAPVPAILRQDFPFKLEGSIAGAPAVPLSRTLDFDGDNKTDVAVARAASAVSQTTWIILNSNGGSTTGISWGLGVGYAAGDRVAVADYDADGKTDVAIWRPGAPLVASFYILNSATNTATVTPFGQIGDDPSIVGDYDGDGKADPAVYRAGAAGLQSTFYYRGSLSNPSGNVTFVPWGVGGDKPIQGDFNGDGKYDFHVARDSGGSAVHYRLTNGTASVTNFSYGLFSDRFLAGDFDADAKDDMTAVRVNGANLDWYVWMSGNGTVFLEKFGSAPNDYLTPGDYDGDGKWDLSVWRSGAPAADTRFFNKNTFASPQSILWGSSAGAQTPPDYPVATFGVH